MHENEKKAIKIMQITMILLIIGMIILYNFDNISKAYENHQKQKYVEQIKTNIEYEILKEYAK